MPFHSSYLDKARIRCHVHENGCGRDAKEYWENGPAKRHGAFIGPALTPARGSNEKRAEEHERNDGPIGRRTIVVRRSHERSLRQEQKDCTARWPDLIQNQK